MPCNNCFARAFPGRASVYAWLRRDMPALPQSYERNVYPLEAMCLIHTESVAVPGSQEQNAADPLVTAFRALCPSEPSNRRNTRDVPSSV